MQKRDRIYKGTINGKRIRQTDAEGLGEVLDQVLASSHSPVAAVGCVPWEYEQRFDDLERIKAIKAFSICGPQHPETDFIAFFRLSPKNTADVDIVELVSGNEDEISQVLSREIGAEVVLEPFIQWGDVETRKEAADVRAENFSKAFDYPLIATAIAAIVDIFCGYSTAAIPVLAVGVCWIINHQPLKDFARRGRSNAFINAGLTLGSPWATPVTDITRFIRSVGRTAQRDRMSGLTTVVMLLLSIASVAYFSYVAATVSPVSATPSIW